MTTINLVLKSIGIIFRHIMQLLSQRNIRGKLIRNVRLLPDSATKYNTRITQVVIRDCGFKQAIINCQSNKTYQSLDTC